MPTYRIISPDGRQFNVTGDRQPTQEEAATIFASRSNTPAQATQTTARQMPKYDDILNNKNLSQQQKVEAIRKRGEEFNKGLDKEYKDLRNRNIAAGILEIGSAAIPIGGGVKLASKVASPLVKKAITAAAPRLALSGATYGAGRSFAEGAENAQDFIKNMAQDAAVSVVGGKVLEGLATGGKTLVHSNAVQKTLPKVIEGLTSVPSEMTERAIQKELTGNSIFKGKMNEKQIAQKFNELGEQAVGGFQKRVGQFTDDRNAALAALPETFPNPENLATRINDFVGGFQGRGTFNPASEQVSGTLNKILDSLDTMPAEIKGIPQLEKAYIEGGYGKNLTVDDVQGLKDFVGDKLSGQYAGLGRKNKGVQALKGVRRILKEEIHELSPAYAQADKNLENILTAVDEMGGLNAKTIGGKLRNFETPANIERGFNEGAVDLDRLLPAEYQFLDTAKDLNARQTLERWGAGRGGEQGALNTIRNHGRQTVASLFGGAMGGVPGFLAGIGLTTPRIVGKGTVQAIGNLNRISEPVASIYNNYLHASTPGGITLMKQILNEDNH